MEFIDSPALFKAFEEHKNRGRSQEINYVARLNEKVESNEIRQLIRISEAFHEKRIKELADTIKKKTGRN